MIYKLQEVPGVPDMRYMEAPFDKIVKKFARYRKGFLSGEDMAGRRMQHDSDHFLSENGSWTRHGVLYLPNAEHRRVLLPESLVFRDSARAVEFHEAGNEIPVDDELVEEALASKGILFLDNLSAIPTNRFGEDRRTIWLFEKNAQEYGQWLKDEKGIEVMFLRFDDNGYIDQQSGAYVNQVWLGSLGNNSYILGNCRDLYFNDRAFGVSLSAAGGAESKKPRGSTKLLYTSRQLTAEQERLRGVRAGELGHSELEQTIAFLESLKQ